MNTTLVWREAASNASSATISIYKPQTCLPAQANRRPARDLPENATTGRLRLVARFTSTFSMQWRLLTACRGSHSR